MEGVVSCNLLCRSSPKGLEIFGSFARPKTTVSGSIKWPLCVLVIAVLLPWIGWGKGKNTCKPWNIRAELFLGNGKYLEVAFVDFYLCFYE